MTPSYEQARQWFTPARQVRFWRRIEKTPDGCWLWQGATKESGHGQIDFDGHNIRVHRLTWLLARRQDLPEYILSDSGEYKPFVVRHLICNRAACCNPAHLVGGSQQENVQDIWAIHHAHKLGKEREAQDEYRKTPYIGYFSERTQFLSPLSVDTGTCIG
jgi:hypothetical protein